jgi:anti-sigma factor RsiW
VDDIVVTRDDLMRYLDGELPEGDAARVRRALEHSTELRRELTLFQALKEDVQGLSFDTDRPPSTWHAVNRRLTRPVGWILLTLGAVLWSGYGGWVFATSAADPVEKLAVAALALGFLILLGTTIFERMSEYRTDPYRDIQR